MPDISKSHTYSHANNAMYLVYRRKVKMRQLNFFSQIRAAQNMTNAFERNRKFSSKDLETLGLPSKLADRFQK
jgi:hypothetical protein